MRPAEAKERPAALGLGAVAADWNALLRLRMTGMVFVTALVGALLAGGGTAPARALGAALWITLVTGCASILNQVLERDTDARMERTRERPLVTGRVDVRDALLAAAAMGASGVLGLALGHGLLAALLSLATLTLYVAVYTPMKRVSTLNTVVGAVAGAAPPMLGYVALADRPGPWGWVLFAVLFAWQFPHFMAIAWLYRADYARAGLRMLPALPGSEGLAGRQAVLYAVTCLPVSLLPFFAGLAGAFYALGAALLGGAYLAFSVAFALREDARRARMLLLVSLVYLPLLLGWTLLDPLARASVLTLP